MTTYAVQAPAHSGAQLTFNTPASGDVATPGSGIALMVLNPSGGSVTCSLPMPTSDGVTVGPRVVTCPQGAPPTIIPVPSSVYGVPGVSLTWSGTLTAVQVALITIP